MAEVAVIGNYDIRDRKLADAGTGTSVASTDAVVLKDTNGNYVEIDRDSFTDAVRSALGPILTNMTQKTAASGGVLVNDSNDVGTMNLSNLASVLSGSLPFLRELGGIGSAALNTQSTVPGNGFYAIYGSSNLRSAYEADGVLFVYNNARLKIGANGKLGMYTDGSWRDI